MEEWLKQRGFEWCERLPYSYLPGWTNGKMSVIKDNNESFDSVRRRYEIVCGGF